MLNCLTVRCESRLALGVEKIGIWSELSKKRLLNRISRFPWFGILFSARSPWGLDSVDEKRFLNSCDLHNSVCLELDNRIHFRLEAVCIELEECEGLVTVDVHVCFLILFILLDDNLLFDSIKTLLGCQNSVSCNWHQREFVSGCGTRHSCNKTHWSTV